MYKIDQFFQWVGQQDQDQAIDHNSWHTCAMGQYAKATDQELESLIQAIVKESDHGYDLVSVLDQCGYQSQCDHLKTYGDIANLSNPNEARQITLSMVCSSRGFYLTGGFVSAKSEEVTTSE